MSGSGGMGGGGGGFPSEDIACERLQFETEIRSSTAAVIRSLVRGQVLGVELRQGTTETVVLVSQGQDIGGIVSPKATRLRECIRAGTTYSAIVIEDAVNNVVRVRIAPNIN